MEVNWEKVVLKVITHKTNKTTFTQVTTNANDVKQIYCGGSQTFILKNDDTLWGTGYNQHGNLGLGDETNRTNFTQVTTNTNNIKSLSNQYIIPTIIKVYDLNTGLIETLDTNNFKKKSILFVSINKNIKIHIYVAYKF